ncbi:MAG: hypothetical protein KF730_07805 [Sphingomonas sp.]|uniref:hypothetical protein n=1 Tax=Sphingomonas sp. TaxID=28214 RepID=UPI0025E21687|nr:hypothetical protein [Sphingomonas sp.]MBX3564465.1 hypothetical protein [Sphingomonas sp.]
MITSLLSLALYAAGAQDPEVRIEAYPARGYIMRIADHAADLDLVASLTRLAEAKCGAKLKPRFGKFNYDNIIGEGGARMFKNHTQRFECYDPANDPYKPAPADWKPSERDNADLNAFAQRFMTAIDKGDAATGMPMMEANLEITNKEWMDTTQRLREHAGGPGKWTLNVVGWANNPEGTSHPGTYAFVTIDGSYPRLNAYCGYLLIYRDGLGRYWVSQRSIKVVPQAWVDNGSLPADQVKDLCKS